MLYWFHIWWMWTLLEYSELIIMLKETGLGLFELYDMVHYPAGSTH